MFRRPRFLIPLAAIALLSGLYLLFRQPAGEVGPRENLALITSLPIYWGEGADIASLASGKGELPWVRASLEERYNLLPIDSLSIKEAAGAQFNRLIIAQPRALSPQDNVMLDEWVKRGGRALLIIDPLLTGSYSAPLGHPEHPVAVGLLPPVLERWGIGIRYDESQPFELQYREAEGVEIPFAMAGEVFLRSSGSGSCTVSHEGLLAQCMVGKGRVTLLADATLFEFHEESEDLRKSLFNLIKFSFE